jgi:hypothetical protein
MYTSVVRLMAYRSPLPPFSSCPSGAGLVLTPSQRRQVLAVPSNDSRTGHDDTGPAMRAPVPKTARHNCNDSKSGQPDGRDAATAEEACRRAPVLQPRVASPTGQGREKGDRIDHVEKNNG